MKKYFLYFIVLIMLFSLVSCGNASQATKLTAEQSDLVKKTLKECGVTTDTVQHDETLDNAHFEGEKGYRVTSGDTKNIIIYITQDGKLYNARWADHDLYKDGQVLGNLTDYTLTLDEASNIQYNCQEGIKKLLKSPKSADFPNIDEWGFQKDNGVVTVQSYVDAQNSFGADMRSTFQFKFDKDGNVISLIFDGKELM